MIVPRARYFFGGSREKCYRWPADTCDGSAPTRYTGTDPNVQPGSLLAVPPNVAAALHPTLVSEPAKRILHALTNYGGYLVDNTAGNRATGLPPSLPPSLSLCVCVCVCVCVCARACVRVCVCLRFSLHLSVSIIPSATA